MLNIAYQIPGAADPDARRTAATAEATARAALDQLTVRAALAAVDAGVVTTAAAPSAATGVLPAGTAVTSIRVELASGLSPAPTVRLAHGGAALADAQLAAALDAVDWTTPGTHEVLAPRLLRTAGAGALAVVVAAAGGGGFDVAFDLGVPPGTRLEAAADRDVALAGGHLRIPAPSVPIVVTAVAGASGTVQITGGLEHVSLGAGLSWHGAAPQAGSRAVFAAYGPTPDGTAAALYLAGES